MFDFLSKVFGGARKKVYPNAPGWKGADTSQAAAEEVESSATTLRDLTLAEIKRAPKTTIEIAKALGVRFESVQPRTSELRAQGLIVDSGRRGPSRDPGKLAIVWALA